MSRSVNTGSVDQSIRFWAYDSAGAVVTGEAYNSAGMAVSVVVRSAGRILSTTALTLVARSGVGVHTDSSLTEVSGGEYVVDLPDSYSATADRDISLTVASTAITGTVIVETLAVGKQVELQSSTQAKIDLLYDATIITTFTVGATTSTTAFDTDLTAVDNYYRDQQAVFLTGNLRGSVPIQVYLNANGMIQPGEAMVDAPDPGSTGVLIARHMHTVQAIQSGLATQAELLDTHLDVNANGIAIAALNNISPAQVNAEVLDVLNVDTFAELSAPPAATSSLRAKLTWLFMWARNKSTQTATQRKLYADDTTTVVSTEVVSDDATTFTKGEAV